MKLQSLVAFVVCLTAFAPAPFPKPQRKSVEEGTLLPGTYLVTEYGHPGRTEIPRGCVKVRISGEQFSFLYPDFNGDYVPKGTYRMKPRTKSEPESLDMSCTEASVTTMTCIYKVEGKRVTIVYFCSYHDLNAPMPVLKRPRSFDDLPSDVILLKMERE